MIEIIDLYKSFDKLKVLNGLNLKIKRGQTTVIIGRSGCGKSVLLKHIMGIMKPDSGRIFIDGEDITNLSEDKINKIRMKMELVFQGGALFDSLNVAENVGFAYFEHTDLKYSEILKKVRACLSMVDMDDTEDLTPQELSGGMKKRVALARAICMRPEILLYDEPTTGVDPITADGINGLIRSLHDKLGVTSIAVTHDMRSAYRIADSIAMLYEGRIIAEGSPQEIKDSPSPIVQQFIRGESKGPITEKKTDNREIRRLNVQREKY